MNVQLTQMLGMTIDEGVSGGCVLTQGRGNDEIAAGSGETLTLGRLDISRDWGWAPEYVDAMWRMLQLVKPEDFVIATGVTITLEEFVAHSFKVLDLDWKQHVVQDQSFFRPTDILVSSADASKAVVKLSFFANTKGTDVAGAMMNINSEKTL